MKNYIRLLILLVFTSHSYSQGLKLIDDAQLSELPQISEDVLGFVENFPDRYSFEKFVPPVLEQSGASCVGFSSLYYGLSTMYNIKFNISDNNKKFANAFDPYFIYSIIKSTEGKNCDEGSYFKESLDILQNAGSKKMFFPPFLTCKTSWNKEKISNVLPYSKPYSIKSWGAAVVDSDFINVAKNAIIKNHPIIFGVGLTDSFYSLSSESANYSSTNGLWSPDSSEERLGGHALTIVGYDDYKFGGAFRVVNSWGKSYGDNGYLWIKYDDFIDNVKTGYIMRLNDSVSPQENPQIDFDNYQRVDYQYEYSMEGQKSSNKFNGYGIFYSKKNQTSYIGNFINGNMDGYFLLVDDEGIYETTIRDGEFFDFEKLGFSDEDNEVSENRLMAKKYFSELNQSPLKKSVGVKKIYGL